jgi:hypothetical protein
MSQYRRRKQKYLVTTGIPANFAVENSLINLVTYVGMPDSEIIGLMRDAKDARERGVKLMGCVVHGYNDDPRELHEIPEVQELCRRLVALGFIGFLEPATSLQGLPGYMGGAVFGAWEVWKLARGELRCGTGGAVSNAEVQRFIEKDMMYAISVAEDHLADA